MTKHIAVIIGHPDPAPERYCRAFANAYIAGARAAGHHVEVIDIALLNFHLLRTKLDYDLCDLPESLVASEAAIAHADHIVIIFPLWLGDMPALLKGFFEQIFRPGVAYARPTKDNAAVRYMVGKSAHIVITMGMPALIYRYFYRAHAFKNLKRNILQFCGIAPVKGTFIGMIEAADSHARSQWLKDAETYGAKGE